MQQIVKSNYTFKIIIFVQLTFFCPASVKESEIVIMIHTSVSGCSACSRSSFCGKRVYLVLFSPWSKPVLGMQCICPERPAETTRTSGVINTALSTGCGSLFHLESLKTLACSIDSCIFGCNYRNSKKKILQYITKPKSSPIIRVMKSSLA